MDIRADVRRDVLDGPRCVAHRTASTSAEVGIVLLALLPDTCELELAVVGIRVRSSP